MPYTFNPFTGNFDYYKSAAAGGAVATVFGRSGDVVAVPGDYTPAQVGAEPASANIQSHIGLTNLDAHGGVATGALTLANLTNALNSGNYPFYIKSGVANGASAVGYTFDTTNALTNAAAKVLSWKTSGVEIFNFQKSAANGITLNFGGSGSVPTLFTFPSGIDFQIPGTTANFGIHMYSSAPAFSTTKNGVGASIGFVSSSGSGGSVGYQMQLEGAGLANYFAPNAAMVAGSIYPDIGSPTAYWGNGYFVGQIDAGLLTVSGTSVIIEGDARLGDARTPTAHAATHVTGGGDIIANVIAAGNSGLMTGADKTKLNGISGTNTGDQILSDATILTTDIMTNNVDTTKHGFMSKLPGGTTTFYRADGTFASPGASSLPTGQDVLDFGATPTDYAEKLVTGLSGLTTNSFLAAFVEAHDTTADNSAQNHKQLSTACGKPNCAYVSATSMLVSFELLMGRTQGTYTFHYATA